MAPRILIVDDEASIRLALDRWFQIRGFDVDQAENGLEAVELCRSKVYDVVTMDLEMPVMNGFEATQKIRAMAGDKSGIPIIAMTANVLKEEVDRCYEAGMDDFIGKPFDTKELLHKISELTKQI